MSAGREVEVTPRLETAYRELLRQIEGGAEYPDAQWRVSQKFGVSADDLQTLYDTEVPGD